MLVIAVAIVFAELMRELAIEFRLLVGRQQCANLITGLKNELMMLAAKVRVKLIHFDARVAQQGFDLVPLVRS